MGFISLIAKQPNLFGEIYEIIFYIATQMLQLNESLERNDDSELNGVYKRILRYKDSFNPGISSPLSAGSDTSLDGVRFFNGGLDNNTMHSEMGTHHDAQFDRLRGSSDLNACLIIAEAYNSGYKYLDLFATNWSDDKSSDDESKPTSDEDYGVTEQANEVIECEAKKNVRNLIESREKPPDIYEVYDYVQPTCNGHHSINDIGKRILIDFNGIDADLPMYKDEVNPNSMSKISLKL